MKIPLDGLRDFVRAGRGVAAPAGGACHLGVFAEPYLSRIYSGEKTLESRITQNRVAPFGRIKTGDIVLVKRSSGLVEAVFHVGGVMEYRLEETPLSEIRRLHQKELCVAEDFWQAKARSRYAVIFEIEGLRRFEPFGVEKRGQATWIVL